MIGELLEIGDRVTITIEKDAREWGYNPCPDGTIVTVIGFSEIHYGRTNNYGREPGVYTNHSWTKIRFDDGTEKTEYSGRLELVDKEEYDARNTKCGTKTKDRLAYLESRRVKLRDLPHTEFWEEDIVSDSKYRSFPDPSYVIRIDYNYIGQFCDDGVTPMPMNSVSPDLNGGGYSSRRDDEITLIERGNVWKYYHNEPLNFKDVQEEALFFHRLGFTECVRNPRNDLYDWSGGYQQVVEAIQSGLADMMVGRDLYRFKPDIRGTEGLGRRIAASYNQRKQFD